MAKSGFKPKAPPKGAPPSKPGKKADKKPRSQLPGVEKVGVLPRGKPRHPKQNKQVKIPSTSFPPPKPPGFKQSRKAEQAAALAATAAIASAPASEQADWLWERFRVETGASDLERAGLTATCLSPAAPAAGLEESLATLGDQAAFYGSSRGRVGPVGAPSALIITGAAVRAVGLIRQCPSINQACRIGKLFAKHFKQAEQEAVLSSTPMHVAVGTPNRLLKLADAGALKLNRLRYIVLDVHLDAKQRTLLDMTETKTDFWSLFTKHLRTRVESGAQFVLASSAVDEE